MIRNYFKIAWRNILRHKIYSAINVGGLAVGMAVATLIGLWVHSEFTYNTYHSNYQLISQVMQQQTVDGRINTVSNVPAPLFKELENGVGTDFDHVVIATWLQRHALSYGGTSFTKAGNFMSPGAAEMLSLKITSGSASGLSDAAAILLSESTAIAIFGKADPLEKIIRINNKLDVRVVGVYEDIPSDSEFHDLAFIAPFDLFVASTDWVKEAVDNGDWESSSFQILVQLSRSSNFEQVSTKLRDMRPKTVGAQESKHKPKILLHPMNRWHLHSEWVDGKNDGGRIQFVWLFGTIGVFVLLLACINFMNLSTARSEKRAKEVGIRKVVGSVRLQLIGQFFGESSLVVLIASFLALILAWLTLPIFNQIANKQMSFPWSEPAFLFTYVAFGVVTSFISGIYPALYLSSFQPVKALKGKWMPLGFASTLPRQILVILQFTVSTMLFIGTVVVYKQIVYTKNRPIGYERAGLVTMLVNGWNVHQHIDAIFDDLRKTGSVVSIAESAAPLTEVFSTSIDLDWKGKDPNISSEFATMGVSHDFGKTVGWNFIAGRDFQRTMASDSTGLVINESAVKFMGLGGRDMKDAIGETVSLEGNRFKIIGIIKDMLMESPYDPVKKSIFFIDPKGGRFVTARINPEISSRHALGNIESIFRKYSGNSPFEFQFVDQEYALKFAAEEQISRLAAAFTGLAIFISCLGLFGMASYIADQRTKEIGIRKTLGASVTNLWQLLSSDFLKLVVISCIISLPASYYVMSRWLEQFSYQTRISWWIFLLACFGTLILTLLTVSYHAIRTAQLDPIKSLRTE